MKFIGTLVWLLGYTVSTTALTLHRQSWEAVTESTKLPRLIYSLTHCRECVSTQREFHLCPKPHRSEQNCLTPNHLDVRPMKIQSESWRDVYITSLPSSRGLRAWGAYKARGGRWHGEKWFPDTRGKVHIWTRDFDGTHKTYTYSRNTKIQHRGGRGAQSLSPSRGAIGIWRLPGRGQVHFSPMEKPLVYWLGQASFPWVFGQYKLNLMGFCLGVGLTEREREHNVGWLEGKGESGRNWGRNKYDQNSLRIINSK